MSIHIGPYFLNTLQLIISVKLTSVTSFDNLLMVVRTVSCPSCMRRVDSVETKIHLKLSVKIVADSYVRNKL